MATTDFLIPEIAGPYSFETAGRLGNRFLVDLMFHGTFLLLAVWLLIGLGKA